jgi:prepilin-type N-terminal cleavage/methylation domain-containing protein
MANKLTRKQKGFTIVEVLIVLAIAGVIMLVVFLAVPALQRNSRNTQRKSDASHLAGLYSEWISNHSGTAMTKVNDNTGAAGADLTNEKFSIMTTPTAGGAVTAGYTAPASPAADTFYIFSGATCNGSSAVGATGGARSVIVVY